MAQMKRSNTTLWFSMVYLWVIYGYSPWLSNVRIKTAGEVSDPLEKLDWLQAGMGSPWGFCHRRAPSNTTICNGGYV